MAVDHLKPYQFKKGEDDPRRRKPKKRISFEACVARVLDQSIEGEPDKTKRMALAEKFVDELLRSQPKMFEMFLEREWPARQILQAEIEHSNHGPFAAPFMSTEEISEASPEGKDRKDH